jgi:hypothetical protein
MALITWLRKLVEWTCWKTAPRARGLRRSRWHRCRLAIEVLEQRTVPAGGITATKVWALATDVNGNGLVDPGDTLKYTIAINNGGATDATGVALADTIDPNTTFVAGSLHASPLANNDTYTAVGNTPLAVGTSASGIAATLPAGYDLFANDLTYTDSSVLVGLNGTTNSSVSTTHGSVTVNANGSFVYTPNAGFSGSDTFTYTLKNSTDANLTSTATVTINVGPRVWYVNNGGANGTGISSSPFNSLANAQSAATAAGDVVFVEKTASNYGGFTFQATGQSLIGQGVNLVVDGYTLATATSNPTLTGTVTLAGSATVKGLNISSGTADGLDGTSVSGVTVNVGSVVTTTGTAVNLSSVGGNFTFTSISANGAAHGISLSSTSGSFVVTGDGASDPANTTRGRTTAALGGGTLTLGSGGTIQNSTSTGVVLSSAANVTLRNMVIQNNGSGVQTGTNGMTVTNGSNLTLDNTVISGTSGNNGLHATGLAGLTFEHCEIHDNATNSGVAGGTEAWNVRLDEVTGTVIVDNSHLYNSYARVLGTQNHTTTSIAIFVTNSTFDGGSSNNGSSLAAEAFNTASLTLSFTGSTSNNGRNGEGVVANYNDSSTGSFTVLNSSFDNNGIDNGGGADIAVASTKGNVTFDIEGNTTRMSTTVPAGGNAGTSISADLAGTANSTSVLQGKILNNTVGNSSVAESASTAGAGIAVQGNAGIMTVDISGNTVNQSGSEGFAIIASGVSAALTATINVTLHNNSATVSNNVNAADGLGLAAGGGGFADTVNANVSGNIKFDASNNVNAIGGVNAEVLGGATMNLQGYSGAANDSTAIINFLNGVATTVNPTSNVLIGTTPPSTIKGASSAVPTPTGTYGPLTLAPATLSAATVGASYTAVNVTASGGTAPNTFSIYAGALPAGMTLASGGTLSGTPIAGGTFTFTVRATDSLSHVGFQTYTLTVNAPTITFSPGLTLPATSVGAVYSQTITASGATAPYTYSLASGALPAGVTLSSAGVLSGIPSAAGTFTFTVSATDSSTGTGPFTGTSGTYSLTVGALSTGLANMGLGTLRPSKTVTIEFNAQVNNPFLGGNSVSNQGTVSGTNFASVLTDDPNDANGAAGQDPTVTPVNNKKTNVHLDGSGNLVVEDGTTPNGKDDLLTLQADVAAAHQYYVLHDPNSSFVLTGPVSGAVISPDTHTITVPFTSVTGTQIQVNTLGGNDLLTVDYSLGSFSAPAAGNKTIAYDGGSGSNTLAIKGTLASAAETFTTGGPGHSGSLSLNDGTNPAETVTYVNLAPVDMTGSTVSNLVFNLPSGTGAALEDNGTTSQIRNTSGATFETTTFSDPTSSLTVNTGGGTNTITVAALPHFDAALTINAGTANDTVSVNGALSLGHAGGNSGNLSITANTINLTSGTIDTSAGTAGNVTLTAGGAITESGSGAIKTKATSLLMTSSATGTSLGNANQVGSFNASNTTSGNVTLSNTAAPLTIAGISQSGGGSVTVNNTGAVSITGTVSAGVGGAINLTSSGALSESGGGLISTTGTLTTSSAGGTTLNGANTVNTFNATNNTSGTISLTNTASPLTITGITTTFAGASGITVSNTGAISLTGSISSVNGPITLTAVGGTISQSAGTLSTTNVLTTNSVGGTTLTSAGNNVGGFNATNTTSGNIALTVSTGGGLLSITGISQSGGGSVTVSNTSGPISVAGTVGVGSGGAVNLTASLSVSESGGLISTTGTLTTSSAGGTTLNGANTVGTFNAINNTSGNVALTNTASPLTITGISESGGGNITVSNTGAISTTGSTSTAANGNISLTATGGAETIGASVSAGGTGTVSLSTTGAGNNLTINSTISSGSTVTLGAGGSILNGTGSTLPTTTELITATTLMATAGGEIGQPGNGTLSTSVSSVTASASDSSGFAAKGIWINNAGALTVTSATTTSGVILIDAGVIAGGDLTATSVTAGGGKNVRLQTHTSGNINVGSVSAAGGGVRLNSAGSILDADSAATTDITALSLVMSAATSIATGAAPLQTAVSNVAATATTGGLFLNNSGGLTITSVTVFGTLTGASSGTGGSVSTHSPLTISASSSFGGSMTFTAGNSTSPGDDLTINNGAVVSETGAAATLTFQAGDNIVFNTGSVSATAANDSVVLTADTEGTNVEGVHGSVTQTGAGTSVTTTNLTISAAAGIGTVAVPLVVSATSIAANNSGAFAVSLSNGAAATTSVTSLSTVGSSVTFNQTGAGALQLTGPITSGSGAVNGGNISITATNGITLTSTGSISSAAGSGGTLMVGGGVTLNGPITIGAGNITLNGSTSASADIVITTAQSFAGNVTFTAPRDIIIRASLTTTAGGNIGLSAGNGGSGTGAGGVWVDHNGAFTGQVTAAGSLTVSGKDLFATPATNLDAIRIEGPVTATTGITLGTGGGAPANAGTFLNNSVIDPPGNIQVNNPVTLTGTSFVGSTSNGNITFASTIDGAFGLTVQAGTGNITFGGVVGGSTPLTSLTINSANNVNAAAITAGAITQSAGSGTSTFSGLLHATGGSGVNLTGTNFTITGGVTVDAGPVNITDSGTLSVSTNPVNLNANTLTVTDVGPSNSISSAINGTGGNVVKSGGGTLTLSATNGYTGSTTINGGTLSLNGGGSTILSSSGVTLTTAGATLDLQDSEAIANLSGVAGTFVTLHANTLTTGDNTHNTTFAGVISGSGGVTKVGSDTFILTGLNTYTGPTNLNGGTLTVNGDLNDNGPNNGGGAVNLNTAGVVLNGTGTVKGQVAVVASTLANKSQVQNITGTVPSGGTGITVQATATFVQIGTASGVTVNGGNATSTGICVASGGSALIENSSILAQNVDVKVNGGTAALQGDTLTPGTGNLVTGLLVEGGGIVDAGQLAASATPLPNGPAGNVGYYGDITGLFSGTPLGSTAHSSGGNTFGTSASPFTLDTAATATPNPGPNIPQAIRNENTGTAPFGALANGVEQSFNYGSAGPQLGRMDVTAQGDTWNGNASLPLFQIEQLVFHDIDDNSVGFVTYGNTTAPAPVVVGTVDYSANFNLANPQAGTGTLNPGAGSVSGDPNFNAGQKSVIRDIRVTYSGYVFLDPNLQSPTTNRGLDLVKLNGPYGAGPNTLIHAVVASTVYNRVTGAYTVIYGFSGAGTEFGSLEDGNYSLQFNEAAIQGGGPGGPALSPAGDPFATQAAMFWRFFGDNLGNRCVNDSNLTAFRQAYRWTIGSPNYRAAFDFDGNGVIDVNDNYQLQRRLHHMLNPDGTTSPC